MDREIMTTVLGLIVAAYLGLTGLALRREFGLLLPLLVIAGTALTFAAGILVGWAFAGGAVRPSVLFLLAALFGLLALASHVAYQRMDERRRDGNRRVQDTEAGD